MSMQRTCSLAIFPKNEGRTGQDQTAVKWRLKDFTITMPTAAAITNAAIRIGAAAIDLANADEIIKLKTLEGTS